MNNQLKIWVKKNQTWRSVIFITFFSQFSFPPFAFPCVVSAAQIIFFLYFGNFFVLLQFNFFFLWLFLFIGFFTLENLFNEFLCNCAINNKPNLLNPQFSMQLSHELILLLLSAFNFNRPTIKDLRIKRITQTD